MPKTNEIKLDITGMTCDSCAVHVEKALANVPGVEEVVLPSWDAGFASVVADTGVAPATLEDAVKEAGYRATVKPTSQASEAVPIIAKGQDETHIHLMVIGGGSAGFAAAIKGTELGYKVALVNAGEIGGTCVNVGCVPSKALIRAMDQYQKTGESLFRGVHTTKGVLNWGQVVADKDDLVAGLRQAKYRDVLAGYPNINYIKGRATLTGGNGVEINGQSYAPDKIIIATGASPWAPPIAGLAGSDYLTSTTAMELNDLPRSMLVVGANAVGLEQAQIFVRAGVHVTVVELLSRIAPFEDEAISTALQGYLEEEGLRVLPDFQTSKVEKWDGHFYLTGTQNGAEMHLDAEQLLVAAGRRPNTSGMGLGAAGVKLGKRGEILVDEMMQSSNPNIYAAGDVTGRDMFVYVAVYAGGMATTNALSGAAEVYNTSYIARVTFTDPQVASAGLTEAQAVEQGYAVKTSVLPMDYVPRALAARDTRGLVKLVADSVTDKLLGGHILAPEGGEMVQLISMALKLGLTVQDLREMIFPYLTNGEAIKLATLAFEKDVAKLSCCAG